MELIINTTATTLDNLGAELGRTLSAEQIGALMSHPAVAERVIAIGLSNILKDSHAGVTYKSYKTAPEGLSAKKAKIESTLADLMDGKVRAAVASAPKVPDDVAVGRKIAFAMLKAPAKKTLATLDADKRNAQLDAIVAKHVKPETIAAEIVRLKAEAEAKKALLAALPEIELDL